MNLLDIVNRHPDPHPWSEGEKIPWHDPDFSRRMLAEHLSQASDAASRRFPLIDSQIAWIQHQILGGRTARILDLGCGPGLYASRLARFGHTCRGIDFSPAAINYARQQADQEDLACAYQLADLRQVDFGSGYDLILFIYGELNAFRPQDARLILEKAYRALVPGGQLLLEVHTFEAIQKLGSQPPAWSANQSGLFSDRPHLRLKESFWEPSQAVATERYYIIDARTGNVTRQVMSTKAYKDEEYRSLLADCGFDQPVFLPDLGVPQANFFVLHAKKD